MNRRGQRGLSSNPALVGAVTVLVALVAIALSYNANTGLPFVPTRTLYLQLEDGATLRKGEDVRRGGFRIGTVTGTEPARVDGRAIARVTLKLDRDVSRIPRDARFAVRSRTLLGAKYVDVGPGRSRRIFADQDRIPVRQGVIPTQLDDVTGTFDGPTRKAVRSGLGSFGDALAGRGAGLNETLATLPVLLPPLERVAATLADPRNRLGALLVALEQTTGALAPVAREQAHLFGVAASTFGAISGDRAALAATLSETPPTLSRATRALPAQRPFLRHAAELGQPLARAAQELGGAIPELDRAVRTGTPVAERTPAFSRRLSGTLVSLRRLARDPNTGLGLRATKATVTTLNPQLRYLGPYVNVCNYFNFFWTAAADAASVRNSVGQSFRLLVAIPSVGQNQYAAQGATRQANGGTGTADLPAAYFHGQPGGAAVNTNGSADCEAVQRGYPSRLASFAPKDLNIVMDRHTPGSQGPVYKNLDNTGSPNRPLGRLRVPKGQTYTRAPQTGFDDGPQPEGGP